MSECPLEIPKCAPGVSVVLDGCGFCKVCARQLNEDCSLTEPCDHTKGLECNFGASFAAATTRGICRGMYKDSPAPDVHASLTLVKIKEVIQDFLERLYSLRCACCSRSLKFFFK